jgi:broad specificity phosphatase PhoE
MKAKSIFLILFLGCFYLIFPEPALLTTEAGDSPGTEGITTIILVRHAEKVQDDSSDPLLTSEGIARAEELAYILKHVELEAVYSTPFNRTKQTVLPIAKQQGLEVKLYPAEKEEEFLKKILKNHPGKTILIVGHSNTITVMANVLLGEDRFDELDEKIYDNLFIAAIDAKGKATITRMRFGAHTPPKKK